MPNTSLILSLPYIEGGQAQKHVTHNEAIRVLDALVQLSVAAEASEPAPDAADGDRYIVSPGATGAFAGQVGNIAILDNGAWSFLTPRNGWVAHDQSIGGQKVFSAGSWSALSGGGAVNATDRLGINTIADATNRLASAADATLLTHDVSGGHQVKVNKASSGDTASLLFQTGFSGRAEMGTTGADDFEIKVSADGTTFLTGLRISATTGQVSLPNTALAAPQFGPSDLITRDFAISRTNAITNGTGHLGNTYNFPASAIFDAGQTPNLAGAVFKAGYYTGAEELTEHLAIDPNRVARVGVYLRQEGVAGDWSGFANNERHAQYLGFRCYDVDGLPIDAVHHARYRHAGVDSLTTLTQPLAPGDTSVFVADASGWNETAADTEALGLVIFGYRNAGGALYDYYSRIEAPGLFDLGDVNKATNQITLNAPLPANMGNPDDPAGVWPVGTRIANRASGWNYKFGFFENLVPAATDTWFRIENAVGGIDESGRNVMANFPPGTARVRPVWLLNYTNRAGGFSGFPDTGAAQRIWVAGLSVEADPTASAVRRADGSCEVFTFSGDPVTGAVTYAPAALTVAPL